MTIVNILMMTTSIRVVGYWKFYQGSFQHIHLFFLNLKNRLNEAITILSMLFDTTAENIEQVLDKQYHWWQNIYKIENTAPAPRNLTVCKKSLEQDILSFSSFKNWWWFGDMVNLRLKLICFLHWQTQMICWKWTNIPIN